MQIIKAEMHHSDDVHALVQRTVSQIYPNYYPQKVVEFFLSLHNPNYITSDIKDGNVYILIEDGVIIGTGTVNGEHINRLFVLPSHQGKGYGGKLMDELERIVSQNHRTVQLDASLSAAVFYEKRGYKTVKHESYDCEGAVLVSEIMAKNL